MKKTNLFLLQVEVSNKFQTVEKLQQYYLFIPLKVKRLICIMYIHDTLRLIGNNNNIT